MVQIGQSSSCCQRPVLPTLNARCKIKSHLEFRASIGVAEQAARNGLHMDTVGKGYRKPASGRRRF